MSSVVHDIGERLRFEAQLVDIGSLFARIDSSSGRGHKEQLLSSYQDKDFLKKILLYTYNPYYVYGINKRTFDTTCDYGSQYNTIFEILDVLRNNTGTTDQTKNSVRAFLNTFLGDEENLLQRIILKDLKIGINIETINKVFPKLIPTFKVSLCQPYETEKDLRGTHYIVQPKLDGVRCIAIVNEVGVELFSRNGSRISGYEEIETELTTGEFNGFVLDGEIMGENFDKTMNDLFSLDKKKKARYFVFDIMTIDQFFERRCAVPYDERYLNYHSKIPINKENSCLVPVVGTALSKENFVSKVEMINSDYVAKGYEGSVVKDCNGFYEFKRSYSWLKYKAMLTDEFRVVSFKEGQGKYSRTLGAITVSTKDEVLVDVGSGFSDKQRDEIWNNQGLYAWQLAEVQFQEYTKDGSLRFPTFKIFRNDK